MPSLFLIRHGQTEWTREKRFTGWGNAPLSDKGFNEALSAARALKASGSSFDICYTSRLERAKKTTEIIHNELKTPMDQIQYRWRLNERHYGALQGELRSEMVQKYGSSDVMKWRSSYRGQPPELLDDDPRWQEQLDRLPEVPQADHPRSESMFQAAQRAMSLWKDEIVPALKGNKNIIIIAHTNSIRSIIGNIEGFNEAQLAAFRIPTAVPRHYDLNDNLTPLKVRDLTINPKARILSWATKKRLKLLAKS